MIKQEGYFGTSGTNTAFVQDSQYKQLYHYPYKFPNVDGYKFIVGFVNIGWTNGNTYQNILIQNNTITLQEGMVNVCFDPNIATNASGPLYFIGIYIKA